MKTFITFLLILSSLSDGKSLGPTSAKLTDSPTANVTVNVTWAFNSGVNVTSVVLTAKNLQSAQYAAIGLSQNQSMGEAHVFMCKRCANDTIVINRYINPHEHERPQPAGPDQGGLLTPGPSQYLDGAVICQFNLSNFATQTLGQVNELKPLSQSGNYYPIFAVGLLSNESQPQYHGNDSRIALPYVVQLNNNEIILYKVPSFNKDE